MNAILLQATDVLFFRDGRPMNGSLAGHTAAWPLPDVTNHARHAALHRADLEGVHTHRRGRSRQYTEERDRQFGSLLTAGPFPVHGGDLIKALLHGHPTHIVVGGQQRVCTAELKSIQPLPLPKGLSNNGSFTALPNGKFAVKWVLLSPAVWPEIPAGMTKEGRETRFHPGGWLPNWICPESGAVLLRTVNSAERHRRRSLNYDGKGYAPEENSGGVSARLVAAIIPKPIIVTGWALGLPDGAIHKPQSAIPSGANSTHLAVAAGAVYYFEAESAGDAATLASVLNWHGAPNGTAVKNRRSTLMGEKGFGLGVCGTWSFYERTPTQTGKPEVLK